MPSSVTWNETTPSIAGGKLHVMRGGSGRTMLVLHHDIGTPDRLPFYDRSFVIASFSYGARDYETAIDAYRRVLERYPDDIRVLAETSTSPSADFDVHIDVPGIVLITAGISLLLVWISFAGNQFAWLAWETPAMVLGQ